MVMNNWVYGGWGLVEASSSSAEPAAAADESSAAGIPRIFPFVMSVGFNPHFKDKSLTVEVHFLNRFSSDFYGSTVRIVSCYCIREQGAFTTLEALIEMIKTDCRDASARLPNQFAAAASHPFLHTAPEKSSIPYLVCPLQVTTSVL
jgi:riboflavin kinase